MQGSEKRRQYIASGVVKATFGHKVTKVSLIVKAIVSICLAPTSNVER